LYSRWDEAKCSSVDITTDDPFFSDDEVDIEEAVAFCNGDIDSHPCPLLQQCLNFSLENNIEYGVFGGMSPLARKAMRKKLPDTEWRYMTQQEALDGLSIKDVSDMKRSLSDA
jgi:hypothetical protein